MNGRYKEGMIEIEKDRDLGHHMIDLLETEDLGLFQYFQREVFSGLLFAGETNPAEGA